MMRELNRHPTIEKERKEFGVDLGSCNASLMFVSLFLNLILIKNYARLELITGT